MGSRRMNAHSLPRARRQLPATLRRPHPLMWWTATSNVNPFWVNDEQQPPGWALRSTISVRLPRWASWVPHTSPAMPPPTTTASYFPPTSMRAVRPSIASRSGAGREHQRRAVPGVGRGGDERVGHLHAARRIRDAIDRALLVRDPVIDRRRDHLLRQGEQRRGGLQCAR